MSFDVPQLDDRKFQDIVDELKRRIPLYCPEWTDHNVSDPGVALIELFAYMAEQLLYRMNQIPERHYFAFAQWLGIQRQQPKAATVPITFWLTQAPQSSLLFKRGTVVKTTQTELEPSQEYVLEQPFTVYAPKLVEIVTHHGNQSTSTILTTNGYFENRQIIEVFSPRRPALDDTLYLCFDDEHDLGDHLLHLQITTDLSAPGGGRQHAPYEWSAFTNRAHDDDPYNPKNWQVCEVEDATENMNRSGVIALFLPTLHSANLFDRGPYQWIRLRLTADDVYTDTSPIWRRITVASMGFTANAIHSKEVFGELVGLSTGLPSQRFQLQQHPIFRRLDDERLLVHVGDSQEQWTEVSNFAHSSSTDRHYTVDSSTGEICLGSTIRTADGQILQRGMVPPIGAELVFTKYRFGGGIDGNVDTGKINTLKTSDPNVRRVLNRKPARGGKDAETLDELKMRTTHQLGTPTRAVTAADFIYLATEAFNHRREQHLVGKAWCLPTRQAAHAQNPNATEEPATTVQYFESIATVYVLPTVRTINSPLTESQLTLPDELRNELQRYLQERCLVTTTVEVRQPELHWFSAVVSIHALDTIDQKLITERIRTLLTQFINPFHGGPAGKGWALGQPLRPQELYYYLRSALLQSETTRLLELRAIELWRMDPTTNLRLPGPALSAQEIEISERGVVVSGKHEVRFL